MEKDLLKKLADSPEFIAGIYNYCDRWCERCPFTSRCMNFALSAKQISEADVSDTNSNLFWEELHEIFNVTIEMVREMAAEQGVDIDRFDPETATETERINHKAVKNHQCTRFAKQYADMAERWFESAENILLNAGIQLEIGEMGDVIRWYQHQIYVKIMRALHGKIEEHIALKDNFPKDSDGSAKVALIAIERSMAAWAEITSSLPEYRNSIAQIQIHLEKLRQSIETVFPDATRFVRPGFDEIHQYPQIGNA